VQQQRVWTWGESPPDSEAATSCASGVSILDGVQFVAASAGGSPLPIMCWFLRRIPIALLAHGCSSVQGLGCGGCLACKGIASWLHGWSQGLAFCVAGALHIRISGGAVCKGAGVTTARHHTTSPPPNRRAHCACGSLACGRRTMASQAETHRTTSDSIACSRRLEPSFGGQLGRSWLGWAAGCTPSGYQSTASGNCQLPMDGKGAQRPGAAPFFMATAARLARPQMQLDPNIMSQQWCMIPQSPSNMPATRRCCSGQITRNTLPDSSHQVLTKDNTLSSNVASTAPLASTRHELSSRYVHRRPTGTAHQVSLAWKAPLPAPRASYTTDADSATQHCAPRACRPLSQRSPVVCVGGLHLGL
jgi:hypothetical protein